MEANAYFAKAEFKTAANKEGFNSAYSGNKGIMFITAKHPESKGRLIATEMRRTIPQSTLYNCNKYRKGLFKQMWSKPCYITTPTKFKTVLV